MAFQTVIYSSAQLGMPSTTLVAAGGLDAILQACLVDGHNSRTATSVTRSGSTATVTFTGTNNFAIGEVIENAGWAQAEYNGRFKITGRGAQTVSFTVGGTPTSPGSGSAQTIKHPAAGWSRTSLGTNISGYRTKSGSLGHYFQVEDNNPYTDSNASARTRLAEGLTALDTATSLGDQRKIAKANGTWVLVADGRTCYMVMNGVQVLHFGEFTSFNGTDLYSVFQTRGETGESSGGTLGVYVNGRTFPAAYWAPGMNIAYAAAGITMLRGNSQLAGFVNGHCLESNDAPANNNTSSPAPRWQATSSPNPADNSIPITPLFVVEYSASTILRGQFRGMYWPLAQLDAAQFVGNVARLDDVVIMGAVRSIAIVRLGPNGNRQVAFDLGDWA